MKVRWVRHTCLHVLKLQIITAKTPMGDTDYNGDDNILNVSILHRIMLNVAC